MPEFVRVKLMQVDFGAQSPARDPYCAVSIKEAVADAGKLAAIFWSFVFRSFMGDNCLLCKSFEIRIMSSSNRRSYVARYANEGHECQLLGFSLKGMRSFSN